jgi:hypothetical protein
MVIHFTLIITPKLFVLNSDLSTMIYSEKSTNKSVYQDV